jgi:P27 family predicted phage terminase small subunit
MRGRKPKPAQLRVIEGGNDDGRGAAYTGPKAPTCPAHLNPSAKAEWKRLGQQLFVRGIIGEGDRAALAAYCQAYGRWVEAERKLAETPLLIKLPSGYIQQSPWLAMANKQLEIMHKYMAELGLSPVSRSRVSIKRTPGPKPWEFGLSASRPADAYLKPRR